MPIGCFGWILVLLPYCVYDTYRLVVRLTTKSPLMKLILYVFVPYMSYGIADFLAQEYVVTITHTMPDVYKSAVYFLIIPFILFVIVCFVCLIYVLVFFGISIVLLPCEVLGCDSIVSRVRNCVVVYLGLRNSMHVNYLMFGSVALCFVVTFLLSLAFDVFDRYNSEFIHYTSYYKNNQTCSKVDKEFYIRTLGDNQVSVSPFKGKMPMINVEGNSDNGNKKFITTLCN